MHNQILQIHSLGCATEKSSIRPSFLLGHSTKEPPIFGHKQNAVIWKQNNGRVLWRGTRGWKRIMGLSPKHGEGPGVDPVTHVDLPSFPPTVLLQIRREQGRRKIYLFLALPPATKLQLQDRESDQKAADAEDDLHRVQEKGDPPEDQGRTLRRGNGRSKIGSPTFRGRNRSSTSG